MEKADFGSQAVGPGLAPAVLEQLFVPFFTTQRDGSGIGLNLARRIAQRHCGKLRARANSPLGTVFRLSLPPAPGSLTPFELHPASPIAEYHEPRDLV